VTARIQIIELTNDLCFSAANFARVVATFNSFFSLNSNPLASADEKVIAKLVRHFQPSIEFLNWIFESLNVCLTMK